MLLFFCKAERGSIPQGLVGSHRIVLYQPLGQSEVKHDRIRMVVSKLKELFFEGSIEPFVLRIVLGGLGPAPPVYEPEFFQACLELFVELAPIIRMDMDNTTIQHIMKTLEEVSGRHGCVRCIHPCVGDARMFINSREDISLTARAIEHDAIKMEKKACRWFFEKISNLLFGLPMLFVRFSSFGSSLESIGLNDSLNIPGSDDFLVYLLIQHS